MKIIKENAMADVLGYFETVFHSTDIKMEWLMALACLCIQMGLNTSTNLIMVSA